MIKRLSPHGNSLALIIDRPIMDLLDIDEKTPFKVSTDGRNLVLSPLREASRERAFRKAAAWVHARHARTFKRLAG